MKYSTDSNICYFYHKRNTLACFSEKRLLFFYSIRASWKSKVFAKDNDTYVNLNLLLEMPWFLLGLEARPPALFKFRSTTLVLCLFFSIPKLYSPYLHTHLISSSPLCRLVTLWHSSPYFSTLFDCY